MLQTLEREPQESFHHGMMPHHPMTHGGPHGEYLKLFHVSVLFIRHLPIAEGLHTNLVPYHAI